MKNEVKTVTFWIDGGTYTYSGYFAEKALKLHDDCIAKGEKWLWMHVPPEIHRLEVSKITSVDIIYNCSDITEFFDDELKEYFSL